MKNLQEMEVYSAAFSVWRLTSISCERVKNVQKTCVTLHDLYLINKYGYSRVRLRVFASSRLQIFASWDLHVFTSSRLQIFASWDLRVFTAARPQIFRPADLHIFRFSGPHILTPADLHVFRSSGLHIFSSADLQVFWSSLSCSSSQVFRSSLYIFIFYIDIKDSFPDIFIAYMIMILGLQHKPFSLSGQPSSLFLSSWVCQLRITPELPGATVNAAKLLNGSCKWIMRCLCSGLAYLGTMIRQGSCK